MSKRVLLAGIFHETNTFLNEVTPLSRFHCLLGEQLWEAEGDASPLAGALEVARECAWEVLPVIDLRAMPSATATDDVIALFWESFRTVAERERERGVDGIYLVLHGAMVSESVPDVEGELLRRIRALPGLADVPICGVLDLHGNITEAMAQHSNGLVAYRENPHIDAKNAAMEGARLLERLMQTGERAITLREQPAIVWPPTGTGTAAEPMRSLEARAREIEAADPDILAVNVFGGFSFADVPEAGVSFTLVTVGDLDRGKAYLTELSARAWAMREEGNQLDSPLQDVLDQLEALMTSDDGPIILVEPADNIGGGAPGDTTGLLSALILRGVQNAGVVINDPEAVARLSRNEPGTRLTLPIGGKSGAIGAEQPLILEVELRTTSDGRFQLEDEQSHLASICGGQVDMGPCAVVRHGGIYILLTSHKTPPFDLGQWRSQGIAPETLSVIGVKAAVAHRRAYDPITRRSFWIDTPGPCSSDLRTLPFRHIRRPIYPLDA